MMLAVTGFQHISLGLLILILLPLAPARWLLSYGFGWFVLFLAGAFGQVLLGIMKSDSFSVAQMAWFAAGAFVLFLAGLGWMLCKRSRGRQTI